MCAGSFDEDYYYGSCSILPAKKCLHQLIYITDKDWKIVAKFDLADQINKPNKYFSKISTPQGQFVSSFRDPTKLPDGRIAIATGGFRWNTFGNVCAVSYDGQKIQLEDETIVDDKIQKNFEEIERPCFYNEWMFFSAKSSKEKFLKSFQVGKWNGKCYEYYGQIQGIYPNQQYGYGMNVKPDIGSDDLFATFWLPKMYTIVVPKEPNLKYKSGKWSLEFNNKEVINKI
jgi:hypothetical protein